MRGSSLLRSQRHTSFQLRFPSLVSIFKPNQLFIMTDAIATFFAPAPEPPTKLGKYRILSSKAGIRVSPLQLGAMSIGGSPR